MKLSEMKTREAFDVMAAIAPDVGELIRDEEIAEIRKGIAVDHTATLPDVLPALTRLFVEKHRKETVRILAAITGKTVEEMLEAPFEHTVVASLHSSIEDFMVLYGFFLRMIMCL